jgi:hypothetical protein
MFRRFTGAEKAGHYCLRNPLGADIVKLAVTEGRTERISTSASKLQALCIRASIISDASASNSASCSGEMPSTTRATHTLRSSSDNLLINRSMTSRITASVT